MTPDTDKTYESSETEVWPRRPGVLNVVIFITGMIFLRVSFRWG